MKRSLTVFCRDFSEIDKKIKDLSDCWKFIQIDGIKFSGGVYTLSLIASEEFI